MKLLPGQPIYNETDNYLTIGSISGDKTIDQLPIAARELHGYFEDNSNSSGKLAEIINDNTQKFWIKGINTSQGGSESDQNQLEIFSSGDIKINAEKNIDISSSSGSIKISADSVDIKSNGGSQSLTKIIERIDENKASIDALAKVDTELGNNFSSIQLLVTDEKSGLSALSGRIDANSTSIAGLQTEVTEENIKSKLSAEINRISDLEEGTASLSETINTVDREGKAIAGQIVSQIGEFVFLKDTVWNQFGKDTSKIYKALEFEGSKKYYYYYYKDGEWKYNENPAIAGCKVTSAGIITSINSDGDSQMKLNANIINFDGKCIFQDERGNITEIDGSKITAGSITTEAFSTDVSGNIITNMVTEYCTIEYNGTPGDDANWTTTQIKPEDVGDDKALWQKIVTTYLNGRSHEGIYCIKPLKGDKGDKGDGISIKGTAYVKDKILTSSDINSFLDLYNDAACTDLINPESASVSIGDAYIAQGYLFVCALTTEGKKGFQCVGDITGERGEDGAYMQYIYKAWPEAEGSTSEIETPSGEAPADWNADFDAVVIGLQDYQAIYQSHKYSDETEWSKPIKISGSDGIAGKDGSDIRFVYFRANDLAVDLDVKPPVEPPENPTERDKLIEIKRYTGGTENLKSILDEIGWTDSAQGVSNDIRYEYMSVSIKASGSATWTNFSTPTLWSNFGVRGMDGDGVEYQYYLRALTEANPPNTPDNYDSTNTNWTDDPGTVTEDHPWQYVSVGTNPLRKDDGSYDRDGEGNIQYQTWSTPVLWNTYTKDGQSIQLRGVAYYSPDKNSGKAFDSLTEDDTFVLHYDVDSNNIITDAVIGDCYVVNKWLCVCVENLSGDNINSGDKFKKISEFTKGEDAYTIDLDNVYHVFDLDDADDGVDHVVKNQVTSVTIRAMVSNLNVRIVKGSVKIGDCTLESDYYQRLYTEEEDAFYGLEGEVLYNDTDGSATVHIKTSDLENGIQKDKFCPAGELPIKFKLQGNSETEFVRKFGITTAQNGKDGELIQYSISPQIIVRKTGADEQITYSPDKLTLSCKKTTGNITEPIVDLTSHYYNYDGGSDRKQIGQGNTIKLPPEDVLKNDSKIFSVYIYKDEQAEDSDYKDKEDIQITNDLNVTLKDNEWYINGNASGIKATSYTIAVENDYIPIPCNSDGTIINPNNDEVSTIKIFEGNDESGIKWEFVKEGDSASGTDDIKGTVHCSITSDPSKNSLSDIIDFNMDTEDTRKGILSFDESKIPDDVNKITISLSLEIGGYARAYATINLVKQKQGKDGEYLKVSFSPSHINKHKVDTGNGTDTYYSPNKITINVQKYIYDSISRNTSVSTDNIPSCLCTLYEGTEKDESKIIALKTSTQYFIQKIQLGGSNNSVNIYLDPSDASGDEHRFTEAYDCSYPIYVEVELKDSEDPDKLIFLDSEIIDVITDGTNGKDLIPTNKKQYIFATNKQYANNKSAGNGTIILYNNKYNINDDTKLPQDAPIEWVDEDNYNPNGIYMGFDENGDTYFLYSRDCYKHENSDENSGEIIGYGAATLEASDSQMANWCSKYDVNMIDGGSIYANSITTNQLATHALRSLNYNGFKESEDTTVDPNKSYFRKDGDTYSYIPNPTSPKGYYEIDYVYHSDEEYGTFFDLSNGNITSPNFSVKDGDVSISGVLKSKNYTPFSITKW